MEIKFIESSMRLPLMDLPLRTTLVKIKDRVLLISPLKFTPEHIEEIHRFGPVSEIIAPSLLHHLHVGAAIKNFPEAKVWAAPGLPEKRPDISWNFTLTQDPWPYPSIEILRLNGIDKVGEVVLFCKELKTLIVTDLAFNLQKPKGLGAFLILKLLGTYRRFAVSRLIRQYLTDREAFKASARQILDWNFDQIVMAHGDVLRSQGRQALTQALKERKYI